MACKQRRRLNPPPFTVGVLRFCWLWPVLALLSACATPGPVLSTHLPADAAPVEMRNTPFIAQKRYQCGPASLAMALQSSGVDVSADSLTPRLYIPQLKGSLQAEMIAVAREYNRLPYAIAPTLDALLAELRAGHPVLVLENLGWSFYPVWHYAVVIGYLPAKDQLVLRSGTTRRLVVDTRDFLDDWGRGQNWGILVLQPGELPSDDSWQRYLRAASGLEAAGKMQAAALAYTAATQRWPDAAAAWLGLGNTQYARHDLAAARHSYHQALQRKRDDPVIRNNLAQVLAEQGCKQAARKQIDLALAAAPESMQGALRDTEAGIHTLPDTGQSCTAR